MAPPFNLVDKHPRIGGQCWSHSSVSTLQPSQGHPRAMKNIPEIVPDFVDFPAVHFREVTPGSVIWLLSLRTRTPLFNHLVEASSGSPPARSDVGTQTSQFHWMSASMLATIHYVFTMTSWHLPAYQPLRDVGRPTPISVRITRPPKPVGEPLASPMHLRPLPPVHT